MKRRILVTSALPYANGSIHLGHLVEYIQTDIWVRFQKMQGHEVHYVCADDTHGTPIMLRADKEGITPQALIAGVLEQHKRDLAEFGVAHDWYSTTDSESNRALTYRIWNALVAAGHTESKPVKQLYDPVKEMFLPDRFIKGECPNCHSKDQYGDSCEVCGKTYSPTDLIDPYSVISGAKPERKASEHHFFRLSDARCEQFLRGFTQSGDRLQPEAANKMKEWLGEPGDNKLADWDISRDAPYFGFPIPGTNNQKFFYVWLDAPVGYFGSFRNYFEKTGRSQQDIDAFLRPGSSTEMVHFIGKDILYFHALFWPAMLEFSGYRVPTKVFAHGFLTVDGQKMSKSRGTFITAESYLEQGLNPEWLRYYYAAKLNATMEDLDLSLDDFVARVNSDLIGKYVNIISRYASILEKHFDGKILQEDREALVASRGYSMFAYEAEDRVMEAFEAREFGKATKEIMRVADAINQLVDQHKPWNMAKDASKHAELHRICSDAVNAFRILTYYLAPILPQTAERVAGLLGLSYPLKRSDLGSPGTSLKRYQHLMARIDQKQIAALVDANKESLQPAAPSHSPQRHALHQEKTVEASTAPSLITIDDFNKVDLRVARIVAAEHVEGADK